MSNKMKWSWGSRLAAAVVLAAGMGSANAAVIRGVADPQFTSSGFLSGVFWSSIITFTVDNSCIAGTGTNTCAVSNVSATATLGPAPGAGNANVSLTFTLGLPASLTIHHTAGVVDAFDTLAAIGPSGLFVDPNPSFSGFAWVDWGIGAGNLPTAQFFIQQCTTSTYHDNDTREKHYSTACTPSLGGAAGSTIPATITITQIPEPGVLVLLLAALSGLWYVRRRASPNR